MDWLAAAHAIGAMLLASGNEPAATSHALRTQGAVHVEEAAGLTVLNDPPLQLVVSSGSVFWVSNRLVDDSGPQIDEEFIGGPPLTVGRSGFYPAMTESGELLSVSVVGEGNGAGMPGRPGFRAVIAQFN